VYNYRNLEVTQGEDKENDCWSQSKLKNESFRTLNATEATALAIAKATENAEAIKLSTLEANLEIQNLEQHVGRQEHKTNKLNNQLKHNLQKNSN
jgi:hypothetical protein